MAKVLNKRGTRSEINVAAATGALNSGEVYLITDEDRIAIGTSTSTYESYAKESEAGGGGGSGTTILMDISIVDGELIADYLAQLSPAIVDGEFIVTIL
jgi:hypothetical protein